MPSFGIFNRVESLEIEAHMSIPTPSYQSPTFTSFSNKPINQPPLNRALVSYTELTPQVVREQKIHHGLLYTACALSVSSWFSSPIHKGLQKISSSLSKRITPTALERTLGLSGAGLFVATCIAVFGFRKYPTQRFTLEKVDISALKQTGTISKQSKIK